jgi:hypothetical protein
MVNEIAYLLYGPVDDGGIGGVVPLLAIILKVVI